MQPFDLAEVQSKNHPHADCARIGLSVKPRDDADDPVDAQRMADEFTAEANEYLSGFTYLEKNKCPGCDWQLGGLFGSFIYGLCYGEGRCANCGYPCRANHRFNGSQLDFLLPYHPDSLRLIEETEQHENDVACDVLTGRN